MGKPMEGLGAVILGKVLDGTVPKGAIKLVDLLDEWEAKTETTDNPFDDLSAVAVKKLIKLAGIKIARREIEAKRKEQR